MKKQEEKKSRLSEKPSVHNLEDTTDAGKTSQNQMMNKGDLPRERMQTPNETNVSENTQEKIQQNEPGNLERKGAENSAFNQHRKNQLDHLDTPNHGDV